MEKTKVVITMEGGLIQSIEADQALEVVVVDFDTEGNEDHPCIVTWKDPEATNPYTAFVNTWIVKPVRTIVEKSIIEKAFAAMDDVRANYKAQGIRCPFRKGV